jgi:hypothetical protein
LFLPFLLTEGSMCFTVWWTKHCSQVRSALTLQWKGPGFESQGATLLGVGFFGDFLIPCILFMYNRRIPQIDKFLVNICNSSQYIFSFLLESSSNILNSFHCGWKSARSPWCLEKLYFIMETWPDYGPDLTWRNLINIFWNLYILLIHTSFIL